MGGALKREVDIPDVNLSSAWVTVKALRLNGFSGRV